VSLPSRLAAMQAPEPPATLVRDVLRRVRGERIGPWRTWGLLGAELGLFAVALWYVSGLNGLVGFVQRTAADAGAVAGWGSGQSDPPPPAAGDLFLLLVSGLLMAIALYHLSLLSRQELRRER